MNDIRKKVGSLLPRTRATMISVVEASDAVVSIVRFSS